MATRDTTWRAWNIDWWERQATHGGLIAGASLGLFHLIADSLADGWAAALTWLRMTAAIILGPETLDPMLAPEPAAVTGTIVHLSFSAAFGAVFGSIVARYRALRRGFGRLLGAAAAFSVLIGLINVYSIAPVIGWRWFPEGVHPVALMFGHGVFYGGPLALYLHLRAARRRRLGLS